MKTDTQSPGDDGIIESLALPLVISDANDANRWRGRIGEAYARVELLDRQCRLFDWMQWLDEEPKAKGIEALKIEYLETYDGLKLDVCFQDGRRYCFNPESYGGGKNCYLALVIKYDVVHTWKADPHAREVLIAMMEQLWALGAENGCGYDGVKMGTSFNEWCEMLFSEKERAQWDASLIEAACGSRPKTGCSKPRI